MSSFKALERRPGSQSWPIRAILAVAAVALCSPASAAEKGPEKPDFWGVWMGLGGSNPPDPRWRPTPWTPAPELTEWGAQESKRWSGFETPTACDPFNPVWFMGASPLFPIEILQGPKSILISYEATSVPRRIYMDGRGHPPDWDPSWLGHSIGHWEGDILVVDTVGTNGRAKPINGFPAGAVSSTTADAVTPRLPASDKLHMVERIRLVGGGEFLENEITVTDLKTYKRSFSAKRYWQRRTDIDMQEYYCSDNARPEAEGQTASASE